jgi:hypothetical protein
MNNGKMLNRSEAIKSMLNGQEVTDGKSSIIWFDENSGFFSIKSHPNFDGEWSDYYDTNSMNLDGWFIYNEPVLEWQWLIPVENKTNTFTATPSHFTTEESEREDNLARGLIRIEKSKRVRTCGEHLC